jgi:hypothetical protein
MSKSARRIGTNTIQLLIMAAGFVVLAYYLTVSFTSGDLLWFLRGFKDQPSHIVVYNEGQVTELIPGEPGFDALAGAVQTSLAKGFSGLSNTGYSEQSLQDAYTRYVTLEVFFDQPVDMHTWFPSGRTTQMLFPVTGRHSDLTLVVLGDQEGYRVGAPVLRTTEPILEALEKLGFWQ